MPIAKILPLRPETTPEQSDLLLELAFLMTAVDGRLEDAELAAYREVVSWLRGERVSDADLGVLLEKVSRNVEPAAIAARVRELAPRVAEPHRELAFRLAMGLALVDDDAAPAEDVMMGQLFELLQLSEERAEAVAAEVRKAFV